jgi:hypothetical protein
MTDRVDENVEAEKLRQVRALIEDTLREHDVCAHVVLAGRAGRFEGFTFIGATWSNLRLEQMPGGTFIGLRSRAADYVGREAVKPLHLAWSIGAASGLGQLLGVAAVQWLEVAARFDKATGATHTPWKRDDPRDEGATQ